MSNEADKYLPGHPAPKLVRTVRKTLRSYGITPQARIWRVTWAWAAKIRASYFDPRWPIPNEIVAQYTILLLAEMRDHYALKLPYRARTAMTPEVSVALAVAPSVALPAHGDPAA